MVMFIDSLTQANFHALARGMYRACDFAPAALHVVDGVLVAFPVVGNAMLVADFSTLIGAPISFSISADAAAIRDLTSIRGANDVIIEQIEGDDGPLVRFVGPHTSATARWVEPWQDGVPSMDGIEWQGSPVKNYSPQHLKVYLGKKPKAVLLAVYDGQIEQLGAPGKSATWTFTPGMQEALRGKQPDAVLRAKVAFSVFGKSQTIELGRLKDHFVLKVTNRLDLEVDLVVFEVLTPVLEA